MNTEYQILMNQKNLRDERKHPTKGLEKDTDKWNLIITWKCAYYHWSLGKCKKQNDILWKVWEFLIKLNILWDSSPIPKYLSKWNENMFLEKPMYEYNSLFIITKIWKLKYPSSWWMDRQVHPYNEILRNKNKIKHERILKSLMLSEKPPFTEHSRKELYGQEISEASWGGDGSWLQKGTREF